MKKLILIVGPSGAGKTTITNYLSEKYGIPRVLTHTTRPMRPGEKQDVDYHFETDASFARLHFFEQVKYGFYRYGSSRESLDQAWQKHDLVSLIVDIQGVYSYLKKLPQQVVFWYITVSKREELKQRLLRRGDDPVKIKQRLSGSELNKLPADLKPLAHVILNDNLQQAEERVDALVARLH